MTRLPRTGTLLLIGPKGVGKSTLALLSFRAPAIITTEMRPDVVVRYAHRLGSRLTRVAPPELQDTPDGCTYDWPYDLAGADGLVVDSLNGVVDPIGFWRWAQALAKRSRLPLILTGQVTTDGTFRSGTVVPHEVDVVVQLNPQAGGVVLQVEKCRFGPVGSAVWNAQTATGWFVVSAGPAGPTLELWPWASSEVYAAADEGRLQLPRSGIAVAARYTRSRGWLDPIDVVSRRALAEASGLTFVSAEELNELDYHP